MGAGAASASADAPGVGMGAGCATWCGVMARFRVPEGLEAEMTTFYAGWTWERMVWEQTRLQKVLARVNEMTGEVLDSKPETYPVPTPTMRLRRLNQLGHGILIRTTEILERTGQL